MGDKKRDGWFLVKIIAVTPFWIDARDDKGFTRTFMFKSKGSSKFLDIWRRGMETGRPFCIRGTKMDGPDIYKYGGHSPYAINKLRKYSKRIIAEQQLRMLEEENGNPAKCRHRTAIGKTRYGKAAVETGGAIYKRVIRDALGEKQMKASETQAERTSNNMSVAARNRWARMTPEDKASVIGKLHKRKGN